MFFDDVSFAPVQVDDFPGIAQTDAGMPQTMEPGTLGRPIVMEKIMEQARPGLPTRSPRKVAGQSCNSTKRHPGNDRDGFCPDGA